MYHFHLLGLKSINISNSCLFTILSCLYSATLYFLASFIWPMFLDIVLNYLCWLVARFGSCRRRRRQTVRCALPIRLHVWAISSHRLASGCSQKKAGRGPWLLFTLGSGSRPQWLRKRRPHWFFKQHSLWKQQTGREPRSGVWTGTVKDGSFWSNLHKGAGSQTGTVESARFKEVFLKGEVCLIFSVCIHTVKVPHTFPMAPPIFLMKLFNSVPVTLICTDRLHHVSVVQTLLMLACAAGFTHVYENLIRCECVKWRVCPWLACTDFSCGIFSQVKVQE